VTCFHCGEPVPGEDRWQAEIDGATARFCCAGCRAVAQTIHAAGLTSFYVRRDAPVTTPATDHDGTFEDEAFASAVVSAGGTVCEAALLIDGVRCGACVWLVESWLARQPGVLDASVNFATRRARVRYDSDHTGLGTILRAIARIGYRGHPYDPRRRERLARAESRALLLRTALAWLAMMQVMMFAVPVYMASDPIDPSYQALLHWASFVLTLPVVFYSALPFFAGALRDARRRRPGMDVPLALGVGGAFLASAYATIAGHGQVYFDSVTMFVALVLTARLLELRVRENAGDAVESIARETPQMAMRVRRSEAGAEVAETIAAAKLQPGDLVRIATGAPIPADGVVVDGRSSVEEALLTGESGPRTKAQGDSVLAGSLNRASPLLVRVTAAGEHTTLAALSRLVARSADARPRIARLSDRVATWFVASLLVIAALCMLAWSVIEPARALPVALAVLVVSCPCALSLAIPTALASAAGALGCRQVLCVRPDALETLSRVTHVVLDKTGTLTTGDLRVTGIASFSDAGAVRCRAIASALERGSTHPIALALVDDFSGGLEAHDIVAIPGCGIEGVVDGVRYRFGRPAWVAGSCATPMPQINAPAAGETVVALADATRWHASFRFGDRLRPTASGLVDALRKAGLGVTMLSGDCEATVAHVARAAGIGTWRAQARPEDKRAHIAALQARGAVVAMVGDGVNDAPSLAQADVSLALGNAAALTQWTADVVVLGDDLTRVAFALDAARRTFRVIRQNVGWALAYNLVAIPLAATGGLSPLAAAAGMSISSLLVAGNAWRLTRLSSERFPGKAQERALDALPRVPTRDVAA
jgi:Cu2+-exporting ATPase